MSFSPAVHSHVDSGLQASRSFVLLSSVIAAVKRSQRSIQAQQHPFDAADAAAVTLTEAPISFGGEIKGYKKRSSRKPT